MQDTRPQSRCSGSAAPTSAVHFQARQRGGTDFTRPQQANKWWSCSAQQWRFFHGTKDARSLGNYHHAGRIMEDESCSIAGGPCSFCSQHSRECRTYNRQEAEVFGTRCAGCRISNDSCSLVAIKDNRCNPAAASERAASGGDAALSTTARTNLDTRPTRLEGLEDEVKYLTGIIKKLADQEERLERLKRDHQQAPEILSRQADVSSMIEGLRHENEGLKGAVSEMAKEVTALKELRDTVSTLLDEVKGVRCVRGENESRSKVVGTLVDEVSALKSHQSENEKLKKAVSSIMDEMKAVKRELRALEDGSNAGQVESMDDSY